MKKVQQRHQKSNYVNTMLQYVPNIQKIVYINYYGLLISNIVLLFFYRSHPSGYKEKKNCYLSVYSTKAQLPTLSSEFNEHLILATSYQSTLSLKRDIGSGRAEVQCNGSQFEICCQLSLNLCQLQLGDLGEVK